MRQSPGFSLIEVLVVVALLGILSSSVVFAANPIKRLGQARDAQRKTNIGEITNTLTAYEAEFGQYPAELGCDSSIGSKEHGNCPAGRPEPQWDSNSPFYLALVGQQLLKILPVDPKNDVTYHYRYEPRDPTEDPCRGTGKTCRFWIGGRLEQPTDPTTPIYRCSDIELLEAGTGCKEVRNFYL